MNKDAILATFIGFGVGLVIAALVFLGPSIFKGLPKISLPDMSFFTNLLASKSRPGTKPTPTPAANDSLTIESPLPDAIEPNSETLVSGKTFANATVVIEGQDSETVVIANEKGDYAGKITLGEGKNDIIVTGYGTGKTETRDVRVYYTPETF